MANVFAFFDNSDLYQRITVERPCGSILQFKDRLAHLQETTAFQISLPAKSAKIK